MSTPQRIGFRLELDEDDQTLLAKAAEAARAPKAEILRRALRSYAPELLRDAKRLREHVESTTAR